MHRCILRTCSVFSQLRKRGERAYATFRRRGGPTRYDLVPFACTSVQCRTYTSATGYERNGISFSSELHEERRAARLRQCEHSYNCWIRGQDFGHGWTGVWYCRIRYFVSLNTRSFEHDDSCACNTKNCKFLLTGVSVLSSTGKKNSDYIVTM